VSRSTHTSVRPFRRRSLVVTVGLLGGVAGTVLATSASASSTTPGDPFAALRACESSGNYATDTHNGFYGAYQFDIGTWQGLGLSGLPSQASPATQDAAARTLQAQRGWQPWPACSARLGLNSYAVTGTTAPVGTAVHTPAPVSAPAATAGQDESYFTVALVSQTRSDVKVWQRQMIQRGYALVVDGQYGPQSAQATHNFEIANGLEVETPGVVGPQVRHVLAQLTAGER